MTGDVPPELTQLLSAHDDDARDAAWAAFLARYGKLLLLVAREPGGTHDDAMDRYAVTLERLREDDFRRLRIWADDRRSALTTWLGVIARHAGLDEMRRRYGRSRGTSAEESALRQQRRRLADLVTEELLPDVDAPDTHGTTATAELQIRRAELRDRLDRCVSELAPEDQLLLVLRFRDERTAADIARMLGFPTAFHVYRRLDRLATRLREALRRRGVQDPVP